MRFPSSGGTLCRILCVLLLSAAAVLARPPNVVFILADDLGYRDLGCYGSKYYETPNLDRMASEGMRFTNGYACGPNCQPTRAALMSGQYGPRTGVYTSGRMDRFDWESRPLRPVENVPALPLDRITIAQALQRAGYRTGFFGKWHLGEEERHLPEHRGFDEALTSGGGYFSFKTEPSVPVPPDAYLTDFLTEHALDFIRRQGEKPFFLVLAHQAVHAPYEGKPELVEKFRKKAPEGKQNDPEYAAMIASLDESVGRVLSLLEEQGLAKETLVIFSSDNGGSGGYARESILKIDEVTDNRPLRGGEGMLYEGGLRVPYLFRWPGRIAAGSNCEAIVNSVDLYPTLLAAAGTPAPSKYVLDGENYLPLLTGTGTGKLQRDAIFWHFPGYIGAGGNTWRTTPGGAIRQGDWKLVEFFESNRLELYNLRDDVGEQHNLAAEQPERAQALHERMVQWRRQVGARMPTRNLDRQAPIEPKFSKQEYLR